jgi:hypothetical protein
MCENQKTEGMKNGFCSATALHGSVAFPFVHGSAAFPFVIPTRISCHAALDKAAYAPFSYGKAHGVRQSHQPPQEIRGSEAEGSAVPRTFLGNVFRQGVA